MNCGPNNCFTVRDAGGKARLVHNCENVVQSMSRDLLGYWTLEFEKAQIPIVLHAHDEDVACVPNSGAEIVLEQMIEIMRGGPDWAADVPLDAEGELSKFYKK